MKQFVFLVSKVTAAHDDSENCIVKHITTVSSHYEASKKAQDLVIKDIREKFNPLFPIGQYRSLLDVFNVTATEKCPVYIECNNGRFSAFADDDCFGFYTAEEGCVKYVIEKVPFEEL